MDRARGKTDTATTEASLECGSVFLDVLCPSLYATAFSELKPYTFLCPAGYPTTLRKMVRAPSAAQGPNLYP